MALNFRSVSLLSDIYELSMILHALNLEGTLDKTIKKKVEQYHERMDSTVNVWISTMKVWISTMKVWNIIMKECVNEYHKNVELHHERMTRCDW